MVKRSFALLLMLVSLVLFLHVSREPVSGRAIHDPTGVIDRDILGRLNTLCETLRERHHLTVAVEVDTVIADQSIDFRAERLVRTVTKSVDGEWVILYLLNNGNCYFTGSEGFLQMAEDVGISNLDLIVMKEYELSGIDKALESFLSNVSYVAHAKTGQSSEPESSLTESVYSTLLIQVVLALLFAVGLAILLFDLLISRSAKETKQIPTPLFGGDFIQYETTLFGVGLGSRKRSSL